jgi:hypothetical protein
MLLKKSNGLVTILSSTNNAIITVAKSILDEAKIEYCIKTDRHDGKNSNSLAPPIEIQVKDANLNEARNLLADLEELNFEE